MEFLQPKPLPVPRRTPLKPLNSPSAAATPGTDQKRKPSLAARAGKENCGSVSDAVGMVNLSLAEELGVVRRRVERLRAEKERMEKVLREMGLAMEREMREMERRGEEQRKVEVEIRRLLGLMDPGLGLDMLISKPSPYQSLRDKERERRSREAQTAVQGIKCGSKENNTEESIEETKDIEKFELGIQRNDSLRSKRETIEAEPSKAEKQEGLKE